ncbi:MAG: DUF1700 domain-containing protein [Lachnospiraceae bacterium]|nr:DUF1700 domain-containing protein [Lachnospiraceae bacterium]
MNRREFLEQLERLLSDISAEEREEALAYYRNYFDDAGEENEDAVIQELGSPGKVAAIIKADLEHGNREAGEYTDTGYEDERFEDRQVPEERKRKGYEGKKDRKKSGWILLIILAVFTIPLWGSVGVGLLAAVFGVLAAIAGIVIGALAAGICLVVGGIALIVIGFANLVTSVPVGLALLGAGMILLALGILFWVAFIWLAFWAFPRVCRLIADTGYRIFHRGKGGQTT